VKKKRNAETMLFMVGVGTPASRCSIWKQRTLWRDNLSEKMRQSG
jgi:hypothetical protein